MKKIIICLLATLLIATPIALNEKRVDASGSVDVSVTGSINGFVGAELESQTLTLTLNNNYTFDTNIIAGEDISEWFNYDNNLPFELQASVLTISGNEMTVSFTGICDTEVEDYIKVQVPNDAISPDDCLDDIVNVVSEDNKYVIVDNTQVYYKQDYKVSGTVGEELIPQDVVVIIEGNDFIKLLNRTNTIVSEINGLTATITSTDISGKEITITYTGTPLAESHDQIHTTLVKNILQANIKDRIVPNRPDVLFDINPVVIPPSYDDVDDESTVTPEVYNPPMTGIE